MKEKLSNILKRIQSGEKVNLYHEDIEFLEYFEKDSNGISFLELCLKNNIDIPYTVESKLGDYIEVVYLYCKYDKGIYNFNISEEVLFSNYNDVRLIDYIIEKGKINPNIIRNISNIEIVDLLVSSNNSYYFTYLSEEILNGLLIKNSEGKYNIEKYFDYRNIGDLIKEINNPKELIDMSVSTNRYDLLKYANYNILMYELDRGTLLDDLVSKNIIPKALNSIPDNKEFIEYLLLNGYIEYLKNAGESVLLNKIYEDKTLLEILIDGEFINKISFNIYDKETIKILNKLEKLDLIDTVNNSLLEKSLKDVFEDDTLEDKALLEYLLDKGINPINKNFDISDEKLIKILYDKGYYDFILEVVNDNGLLTKVDGNVTILDKIIEDKNINRINKFKKNEVANILFNSGRLDLLAYGDLSTLLINVDDNNTYLDYLLESIKEKKIKFKVIDFKTYSLNVNELALFYITLAKHDMIGYIKELEEKDLLKDYKGTKLIDKLIELDSDITVNKIISDEVKEKLDIAVILKSKGIVLNEVSIPLKEEDYSKEYLDKFNNSLGIGPVFSEGEILLSKLYELFINDGKSDKELVQALVNAYKNALLLNYDVNIKELRNLVAIKEDNLDTFIYIREKDNSFFSKSDGAVHCENTNYNTLLHETGHALHYYVGEAKMPDDYFEIINRARLNPEILKKVEAYSNKFHEIRDNVFDIADDKYNELYDNYYTEDKIKEIEEFLSKSLEEKKQKYRDLGFSDDVLDTFLDNNFTVDEYMEQEWRLYIKEYADSVMRSEFGAFISVGDIIDAIYIGEFKSQILKNNSGDLIKGTYGHGIPYFSIDEKGFSEMIANFAAISKSREGHETLTLLRGIVGDEVVDMIQNYYYENILNKEYSVENKKGL